MPRDASDLARRLADDAEAVCRHYLSNGRRQGRYCEGFRMPADDGRAPRTPRLGAGVRKPPRNETAGSGTRSRGGYGDLSAAEEARDGSRRR
jgi:hypothetical protein